MSSSLPELPLRLRALAGPPGLSRRRRQQEHHRPAVPPLPQPLVQRRAAPVPASDCRRGPDTALTLSRRPETEMDGL